MSSHSADYDIEQADHLNVDFRTASPHARAGRGAAPSPRPARRAAAGTQPARRAAPPPKERAATRSRRSASAARLINTTVERMALKDEHRGARPARHQDAGHLAGRPGQPAAGRRDEVPVEAGQLRGGELVNGQLAPLAHQDPADPAKHPRGIDIFGSQPPPRPDTRRRA